MSSIILDLPDSKGKGEKELAAILTTALGPAQQERNIHSIEWWMIHYYLQGARNFRVIDMNKGTIAISFENKEGQINFRWEDIVVQYQAELGRLGLMDLSPRSAYKGLSLDSMREAAVGQAVLNHVTAPMDLDVFQEQFNRLVVKYGTGGGVHFRYNEYEGIGEPRQVDCFDPVPPWQLLSLPGRPETLSDVRATVRERTVPLDWLREQPGFEKLPSKNLASLEIRDIPIGSTPPDQGPERTGSGQYGGMQSLYEANQIARADAGKKEGEKSSASLPQVRLQEIWLHGPENTVARYIAKVGQHIPQDENYWGRGQKVIRPIAVGHYTPVDSWYGRGLCSRLIGMNNEVEKMLRNLFENVQDMDEMGFLMIPNNLGINKRSLKQTSKPRYIMYSPDYSVPENRPYALQPATTGEFPGRVASSAIQLQDKLAAQSGMMSGEAPGRVDSGVGLGFMHEMNTIPLKLPANEIRRVFVQLYSSLLQTQRRFFEPGMVLQLSTVDDSIAGVVFDEKTREIVLDGSNPIPEPWKVKIGVADTMPRPKSERKQELLSMLQMQLITPMEFRIINMKEDLGFPTANRAEWEQYQKAVLNNIMLFNDGLTPNPNVLDSQADMPDVHLMVLGDFMGKVQFNLASKDVQEAFYDRKEFYEMLKGQYPESLTRPEDVGMEQQMLARQQQMAG